VLKLACPSCGAEVTFQTSIAVYAVCAYCRSLVLRDGNNLNDLGKVANLPPDMSPFRIGTMGKIDGISFMLVGRAKYRWADGTWNEWYCQFDTQRAEWLAEAQGDLMLSFALADSEAVLERLPPQKIRGIEPGYSLKIKDKAYIATDIKDCYCLSVEGEIPFRADSDRVIRSIDLVGEDRSFATLSVSGNERQLFIGHYIDFRDLNLTNLREVPGWTLAEAIFPVPEAADRG